MEDGPDGLSSSALINNGDICSVMANFPEIDVEEKSPVVNGKDTAEICSDDNADSSDCDALVIDESVKPKTKISNTNATNLDASGFRGFEQIQNYAASKIINAFLKEQFNNYVSAKQRLKKEVRKTVTSSGNDVKSDVVNKKNEGNTRHGDSKKFNPKLREYAQYLGLQPTVQFKCSKCGLSGFPSLTSLNEHLIQCKSRSPVTQPVLNNTNAPTTNIRVTRKVFLCSACGTYYENWNLFLHMREVHKRFICLYCLGMFSHSDKLSLHLISKHNCTPNNINSVEDFFNIYKEPCFLMCCDCQKVFTERDDFFNHMCPESTTPQSSENKSKSSNKTVQQKNIVSTIEHVTGDSQPIENDVVDSTNNEEEVCKKPNSPISDNMPPVVSHDIHETNLVPMDTTTKDDIDKSNLNEVPEESLLNQTDEVNVSAEMLNFTKSPEMTEAEGEEVEEETKQDESEDCKDNILEDQEEQETEVEETRDDNNGSTCEMNEDEHLDVTESPIKIEEDLRKVPKLSLKLPKQIITFENEEEKDFSDDSEKLTMEVDMVESENEANNENTYVPNDDDKDTSIQIAGVDVPIVELELEQPLDKFDDRILVQKCLRATILTCVYCNHARKIAVNGKQLALHAIAEHRFSAIVNSITAEELIPESFVSRLKEGLLELENTYFNLESSEDAITFSHVFECFQCRFTTTIHKELYLHNRKMHAKSILLCIMCKSNFYSYSELICHLCPGAYIDLDNDIQFRCCLCVSDELPSAFRLMVHLRKRHHACDVCLELCHNQARLSNHVWKHKLHHLCYRCGIAYRNKPDITKHLYWKHGTESVLCKRCLQKKWPHVYHFCIPPSLFDCDECNLSFTKSVRLRVHKRIHADVKPHSCTFDGCEEKFISKKLLFKHEFKHREPVEPIVEERKVEEDEKEVNKIEEIKEEPNTTNVAEESEIIEEKPEKLKPKVDVYDLPALNLSESDTSESEDEAKSDTKSTINKEQELSNILESSLLPPVHVPEEEIKDEIRDTEEMDHEKPAPILENIWDDFKNYQANKEKLDSAVASEDTENEHVTIQEPNLNVILNDHDYCARTNDEMIEEKADVDTSVDHDYCTQPTTTETNTNQEQDVKPASSPKKKTNGSSSDSSSDSDSSSCTCGSNCSCSSSSGSSSSSSDSSNSDSSTSEGRRRQQQAKKERKKEKAKNKNKESETVVVDVTATENIPQLIEAPIHESDLETTEIETDEEFYDKHPQKLASKLLEEKRNQLMLVAGIGPCLNGSTLETSRPPTPSLPEEEVKSKKKAKYKKRKKKKSSKYDNEAPRHSITNDYQIYQQNLLSASMPMKHSPVNTAPAFNSPIHTTISLTTSDNDSNLRSSKRKRVPNKFYGYSSDEEAEKAQIATAKWRKMDTPSPIMPMVVPSITIKNIQPPPPPPPPPPVQTLTVEPISIRTTSTPGELRIQPARTPLEPLVPYKVYQNRDSGSDTNDSSGEEKPPPKPALYCYCRCPYDEVSEMIGCDAPDCAIEWFHFECVGIMVPPKGHWFCPDCRKKKQKRDTIPHQSQLQQQQQQQQQPQDQETT